MVEGRVKIIVVDDSSIILKVTSVILKSLDYKVVETFLSPVAALDYFQKNQDNIDLVLTDLNMPEMSGIEMIDEMKKISTKKFRAILVTGTTAFITDAIPVIQKPYDLGDLQKAIISELKN